MTEREWLSCTDPQLMLEFLQGKASERKLQLFACACCRRIWHFLDAAGRGYVELIERYVDGKASRDEVAEYCDANRPEDRLPVPGAFLAACMVAYPGEEYSAGMADQLSNHAALAMADPQFREDAFSIEAAEPYKAEDARYPAKFRNEQAAQCDLLRDNMGNPYRPVTIDKSWLTWNDSSVRKIANRIYDKREFEGIQVLADALEEAGCSNQTLLKHCRQPGLHSRGCWVVDLVLGKE